MEEYITLAPPILMLNVTRIDSEKHYSCQVVSSNSKSYRVRRKWEDFEMLSISIAEVLGSKSYTVESGTILFNGAEMAQLPQFPSNSSKTIRQELDSYVKSLLLLPKDILKILPLDKFFGHWTIDKHESKEVLSESLVNKIGAMITMGYDTNDDLTSILKRDQDLKYGSTSSADHPRTDHQTRLENYQRSFSQISQAQTCDIYDSDEDAGRPSANRASEVLTYEEFVAKLANSLSVDISEKSTAEDIRDTNPLPSQRSQKKDSSFMDLRASTQSVDTVIASPAPVRSAKLKRNSSSSENFDVYKSLGEKITLPPRSTSAIPRNNVQGSAPVTEIPLRQSSPADTLPDASLFRKEFLNNDLGLRIELARSDLARKSPTINSAEIIATQKKVTGLVSSANGSSNPSVKILPVTIPSRKESKNWSMNSPEGPRSISPLARRIGKDLVLSSKKPLEVSREDNISTLLRATARRSPDIQSLDSASSSHVSRQPTPLSLTNHFTVKLIQTSGDSLALKLSDDTNFENLFTKISQAVGNMTKVRICYRDGDYELISVIDNDSWEICKETINADDKLTLFLVKKAVMNAINNF
jgi:hypothetical protein